MSIDYGVAVLPVMKKRKLSLKSSSTPSKAATTTTEATTAVVSEPTSNDAVFAETQLMTE